MMLDFLGYPELGAKAIDAMEETLAQGIKTGDLGGEATLHQLQYRLFLCGIFIQSFYFEKWIAVIIA